MRLATKEYNMEGSKTKTKCMTIAGDPVRRELEIETAWFNKSYRLRV